MKISIYNVNDTPIGKGGMGQVYLGIDPQGNRVAVKRMHPELTADAGLRAFFHQEVNTLTQLEHPSIVKMHASFEEHGNLYLVMEYVEGETIEQYVRRCKQIGESEAINLFVEILSAVGFVHQLGFVHRDIKPSNIIIKPDGNICLLDFGIVKDMKNSSGHTVSQIIGTDGYMSPEQANAMSIDARSDVYSLGCVLYYMLVGNHAIQKQSNDHATRMTIIQSVFPRAKDYNQTISDNIQRILDKATNKNMLQRFQSCREFEMEIRGGATNITPNSNNKDTISVGRENCDILFTSQKVSRHHLDITFFNNTGNTGYILADRSSNGTTVGKQFIHNNQIVTSWYAGGKWDKPTILLAGEVELKWEEIQAAFARKQHITKPPVTAPPPMPKPTPLPMAEQNESATGWLIAIYIFAILGGLLGLIFGISVYQQKITLPDGRKIPKYKQPHRTAALIGAILSGISLIIWKTTI
ncbi:MAG: protein kinase [Bacteroidales bacterium]|jgi:serine/threonine-protein kinase|nr:protein kinase [Bacteroidales bacterium]